MPWKSFVSYWGEEREVEQQDGSQCWEKKLQVLLVLSAKQRVSSQRAGVGSAQAECTVIA